MYRQEPALRGEEIQKIVNHPIVQAMNATDPQICRRRSLYLEDGNGLIEDLAKLGYAVDLVGDLRQAGIRYRDAVPILLEWLPRVTYLPLAEDIVRTLSVSFAKKEALPVFLRLFRDPPELVDPIRPATSQPPQEHIRWVIGLGIGILAGPTAADDVIELALDRSYKDGRVFIVDALPKLKDPRVPEILLSLLDDPTVMAFAVKALGKMRYAPALPAIEALADDTDKNVRDQVKTAKKRLAGSDSSSGG